MRDVTYRDVTVVMHVMSIGTVIDRSHREHIPGGPKNCTPIFFQSDGANNNKYGIKQWFY